MKYLLIFLLASTTICDTFRRLQLKGDNQNTPSENLLPKLDQTSFTGSKQQNYAQFAYDYQYWPVFTLNFAWNAEEKKPYKTFFLVSQNTVSFAVTNTFGFGCEISNFCISTDTYNSVNYGMLYNGIYKYTYTNALKIYTTFNQDSKLADTIFQVSTGTTSQIQATSKMSASWPFNAGVQGLHPNSKFFNYVYQSAKIDKEFIVSLKYRYNDEDSSELSYWDINPEDNPIDQIANYQGNVSFDQNMDSSPDFWIKLPVSSNSYYFPNGHFASTNTDQWDIGTSYGKTCIVSDMSQYFMIHEGAAVINNKLAKLVCGEDSISKCKSITKPSLEHISDFFITVYESADSLNDKKQKIQFPVNKLLYINKTGDLASGISGDWNGSTTGYLNMYGCPFDTTIILGQKFLTLNAFSIKLVPRSQSNLHDLDFQLWFGMESSSSSWAWWIILLIIAGCIILIQLIVVIVWVVMKIKKQPKEKAASSQHSVNDNQNQESAQKKNTKKNNNPDDYHRIPINKESDNDYEHYNISDPNQKRPSLNSNNKSDNLNS